MFGQYLTAVFEMRLSQRKAAILERARATAESAFWAFLDTYESDAKDIAGMADAKTRRERLRELAKKPAPKTVQRLHEPLAQGVHRDVMAAIKSYVELLQLSLKPGSGVEKPEWPSQSKNIRTNYISALGDLVTVTDSESERRLRDELNRSDRDPPLKPFTLARARDGKIIRHGETGALGVELNILPASDKKARSCARAGGIDAASGACIEAAQSKRKILLPLSCSKWHEQKFLSGQAHHRSSLIVRKQDRWFLLAQFEMPPAPAIQTHSYLGVDRGVVNPGAIAVCDAKGVVTSVAPPMGAEIGTVITESDKRRRAEQKRRGRSSIGHKRRADDALHQLANHIVKTGQATCAQVVIENLGGQKITISTKRKKGAPKRGWRKVLKRSQLGKLETLLAYKLALAGLEPPQTVFPGGTSITCPKCGHYDGKNRPSQDNFTCTNCGFKGHADSVAAVNIARRGAQMKAIKKGEKLAVKNQNMIDDLRGHDYCGLGPLGQSAEWIVADRAAGNTPYHRIGGTGASRRKSSRNANQNG
jgi:IS605 OrfB family transposase